MLPSLDFLGEGIVHGENATKELDAIHAAHGGGGVLALQERDEPEGAVLLCGLVERRLDVLDLPEQHECRMHDLLVHLLRQSTMHISKRNFVE